MATPPTPAYQRAAEVLADGAWHPLEQVLTAAMAAVPPGQAYRRGEQMRLRQRQHGTARIRGDRETSIRAGARAIAAGVLNGMVRFGTAERSGDQIRRRP